RWFARARPKLTRSPNSSPALLRSSAMISQCFMLLPDWFPAPFATRSTPFFLLASWSPQGFSYVEICEVLPYETWRWGVHLFYARRLLSRYLSPHRHGEYWQLNYD